MPLPGSLTAVTLVRDYTRPDGTVPSGYVQFELVSLGEVAPSTLVLTSPVSFTLVAGHLSALVASTQDADLQPTGIVYRITEVIDGVRNEWFAAVPTSPSTQNINDLISLDPPEDYIVRVKSVNGILPGPDGNVDLGSISAPVTSVAGKIGAVTLVKADVGLGSVDNTSDASKPISAATATALAGKADTSALASKASKPTLVKLVKSDANIQLNVGTNVWGPLTGSPSVALAAQVGDLLELNVNALRQANSNIYLDLAVKVGSGIARYMATDTSTPAGEGNPALYHTALPATGGSWKWKVEAGDIDSGNVTIVFALRNISGASSLLLADSNVPLRMSLCNFGPAN